MFIQCNSCSFTGEIWCLTHLCLVNSSIIALWTGLFPITRCLVSFLLWLCFLEIPELNANSVDPDQTPRPAASDLGLHCLPMSLLYDARQKWVNHFVIKSFTVMYRNMFRWALLSDGSSWSGYYFLIPNSKLGIMMIPFVVFFGFFFFCCFLCFFFFFFCFFCCFFVGFFCVCVKVLRPSQPNGVMSSAVSLPNHTFTGQA